MIVDRDFDADIQIVEREGGLRLEGYAARYYDGTPATEYQLGNKRVERIPRGAFASVLRGKTVLSLGHRSDYTILDSVERSLSLESDDVGLKFSAPFDPEDPDHQRVKSKLQKGFLRGASFHAIAGPHKWSKDGDRHIGELTDIRELVDVAVVAKPCYQGTSAVIRGDDEMESAYQEFVRAECKDSSDDTPPSPEDGDVVRELETKVQALERELAEAKKLLAPRSMPAAPAMGVMTKQQLKDYWQSL